MGIGMRFINGVSLGFEFFPQEAIQTLRPDASWGVMIDLFIVHILITKE